jgi:hypothetical protein
MPARRRLKGDEAPPEAPSTQKNETTMTDETPSRIQLLRALHTAAKDWAAWCEDPNRPPGEPDLTEVELRLYDATTDATMAGLFDVATELQRRERLASELVEEEELERYKRLAEELHSLAATAWQGIRDAAHHESDERRRANDVCDLLLEGGRLWIPSTLSLWIDVADQLPEPGVEVLAMTKANGRQIVVYDARAAAAGSSHCWRRNEGRRWSSAHGDHVPHARLFEASHWMPLADVPSPVLPKPLDPGEDYHAVDVRPREFPMPPEDGS